jgi:8-oxo-dGTP pyrophosphatase MutT (NUDIX family)
MTRNTKLIGNLFFWLLWPGLYFYLKNSTRTRVIISTGNKILIVKNWLGPGEYTLPGGGIMKHEKPRDAAVREIAEEIGVNLEPNLLTPIRPMFIATEKGHSYKCYGYSAKLDKVGDISRKKIEIAEIKWLNIHDALSKYRLNSTANQLITTWLEHNHLLD